MALTVFQEEILRLLAHNRVVNAESYVADGLALNYKLSTPRLSRDIDIFHDSKAAMVYTQHVQGASIIEMALVSSSQLSLLFK